MGNRGTRGGTEYDVFHRYSRSLYHWNPGTIRWLKRQFWKRQRRNSRRTLSTTGDA